MDGHRDFQPQRSQSEAMRAAFACLGGERRWTGTVRGLFGLIRRNFAIWSNGRMEDGALVFQETLAFEDGETQERQWRIADGAEGLTVEGDGVIQTGPGRHIGENGFEISYRIRFGSLSFDYRDTFILREDGAVCNLGEARLLGFPVMKIEAHNDGRER